MSPRPATTATAPDAANHAAAPSLAVRARDLLTCEWTKFRSVRSSSAPWGPRIGRFTLIDAARQLTALHPQPDLFAPAASLLVLLAWPAAALLAAALLITRRDI